MLPIYICDDDRTMLRYLKEQIGKQILIQEYDMTVAFCGTDPEELLAHLRQSQTKRNLYFLDVELKHKKYDGFLLGKEIREIDLHGTMIYITSFGNLAYKMFQYHLEAFDYITKDTPEKVSESLTACMRSVAELMVKGNADPMDYNTVKTGERFCHVPIDEMIFLRHLPDHILWCCMQDIRELNFRAVFRILRRAACPDISEGASFVLSCP